MEAALIAVSVASCLLAVAVAALASVVPLLAWRLFRLEGEVRDRLRETEGALGSRIDVLDEATARILEMAGVDEDSPPSPASPIPKRTMTDNGAALRTPRR